MTLPLTQELNKVMQACPAKTVRTGFIADKKQLYYIEK